MENNVLSRRYDIDWLRAIAVFCVIALHTAVIFSFGLFNVKHTEHTLFVDSVVIFLTIWVVPLLFTLAGASAKFALERRSLEEYRIERRKRILLPAVVWFIIPAVVANFFGLSFLLNLPGNPKLGFTVVGTGHLWFNLYLMIFSVATLPLFVFLRTSKGKNIISKMAGFCQKTWFFLLFIIPVFGLSIRYTDNDILRFFYVFYFVYGFIIFSDDRFAKAISRKFWFFLMGAAITCILIIYFAEMKISINWWIEQIIEVSARWFWVLVLLEFGRRFMNFSNKFLVYLSEASYPIYILHFLILSLVGFYIAPLPWSVFAKFIVIFFIATIFTILIYDFIIRRTKLTRLLFGMKPLK